MNKKAMMDDLFDFLFTVFVALFALLFIHTALVKSIDDRNQQSLVNMNSVMQIHVQLVDQQKYLERGENPILKFGEIDDRGSTLPIQAAKSTGVVELVPK